MIINIYPCVIHNMRELIFDMLFYTWLLFGRSNNYDSTNKEMILSLLGCRQTVKPLTW